MRRKGICIGLLLLLSGCDSQPPAPPPPQAPTIDDKEAEIRTIETHLANMMARLKEFSMQGVAEFYPERFDGTPLLDEPRVNMESVKVDMSIPEYRIESWREMTQFADIRRSDVVEALAKFLKPVALIEYARMKVSRGAWKGPHYEAHVKFVMDAVLSSGGRVAVKEHYVITLTRSGGSWQIVGQGRKSGRRVWTERPTFVNVTEAMGLKLDLLTRLHVDPKMPNFFAEPFNYIAGLAVGDVDGDGFPDILINRIGERRLFRNIEGRRLEDITERSGLASDIVGTGALFFDADNDGDLDLLALNQTLPRSKRSIELYRNDGTGKFENVSRAAGLQDSGPAVSAAAADVDGDGDLDVYVTRYQQVKKGQSHYPQDILNSRGAPPNRLLINNGDGIFTDRAHAAGVDDTGYGLAAAFADYDGDGHPDLYVANDFGDNRLYRNKGDGTFEDVTERSGVGDVGFGMGVDWGDFDGDGQLDLYISNMYSSAGNRILDFDPHQMPEALRRKLRKAAAGNTLLRNLGNGSFEDVSAPAGVSRAGWAWDTHFLDYDNDGRLDMYVANGFVSGESMTDL